MCREGLRTGFTLVESLVAGALIAVAIAAWLGLQFTGARTDVAQEKEQETERLLASLQDRMSRDIRSATTMETDAAGTVTMHVLTGDGVGRPMEAIVVYSTREEGRIVNRRVGGEEESYDFRSVLGEKKLIFELRP